MSAVTIAGATVRLGGRTVLSDVNLEIERGSFVAVLGPNGAGKSTLMRAILGLVPLAAGRIEVLGSPPAQARRRVGYLPQRHTLLSSLPLRGRDLVALGLEGTRWGVPIPLTAGARSRRRTERRRIAEAIAVSGAAGYADRPFGEVSGGEQQRLLVAQALVSDPEILILDEPLDGLDLPNQAALAALLRRVCDERGVTVLLVAHDVNPLLGYLNSVVFLGGGRALAGSVAEVINARSLTELYRAPVEVLETADGRLIVVGLPEAPHHHGERHPEP